MWFLGGFFGEKLIFHLWNQVNMKFRIFKIFYCNFLVKDKKGFIRRIICSSDFMKRNSRRNFWKVFCKKNKNKCILPKNVLSCHQNVSPDFTHSWKNSFVSRKKNFSVSRIIFFTDRLNKEFSRQNSFFGVLLKMSRAEKKYHPV